jgi:hypothetical protein
MTGLKLGLCGRSSRLKTQTIVCARYTGNVGFQILTFFVQIRCSFIFATVGAMGGYHAGIAIHPGTSYGIVVLLGGRYFDAAKLAYDAFEIFQPAIDSVLAEMATTLYAGSWASEDGDSSASVVVDKGTLYMERFVSNGTDILGMFHAPGRLALRSTQRHDELRSVCCRRIRHIIH